MILLCDIGNTHTHVGLGSREGILRKRDMPTEWFAGTAGKTALKKFIGRSRIEGSAFCSVVPSITPLIHRVIQDLTGLRPLELSARTVRGVGIDYPRPKTIGTDRLANAVAARALHGAPVVVVDFGTAVTFDVVNRLGNYVGGIIAPGLAAMTDYLHEKTALLPRIVIREPTRVVGRSTKEAMLAGAVHGYRGLVRELIESLKNELGEDSLPVVATGGYANLMAARLPQIQRVDQNLTLQGVRLTWLAHNH